MGTINQSLYSIDMRLSSIIDEIIENGGEITEELAKNLKLLKIILKKNLIIIEKLLQKFLLVLIIVKMKKLE